MVVNHPLAGQQLDSQTPQEVTILPLENGDRLSRYEFEQRYNAMPHLKKAELIEGIVYLPAALRFRSHSQPHGRLITWLGVYEASTQGVALGDNPTVRLDLDNEPQPDGEYISLKPDTAGTVCSLVFPGLWLAVPALLKGEMTQVLAVLQEGLSSPEHAAFA